jgi:hypothetical protein
LQKPRTVDVWDHGEDHADTREKPQEPVWSCELGNDLIYPINQEPGLMCLPAFGQDFCIRVFDHQSRDQELSTRSESFFKGAGVPTVTEHNDLCLIAKIHHTADRYLR